MHRPHRNIEIFSMSVLDMFASALGAFIVCTIILFPYYKKDTSDKLARATSALKQITTDMNAAAEELKAVSYDVQQKGEELYRQRMTQAKLKQCLHENTECFADLAKTFLLVQIEWQEKSDIDLYVTDPEGNQFSWSKTNRTEIDFTSSKARLSIDVSQGPGIEVWVNPAATPGRYQVDYVAPHDVEQAVAITGTLFDRYGRKPLPNRQLHKGEQKVHGAIIEFTADGNVTVQ